MGEYTRASTRHPEMFLFYELVIISVVPYYIVILYYT